VATKIFGKKIRNSFLLYKFEKEASKKEKNRQRFETTKIGKKNKTKKTFV
jgi:hypothetical protein